MTASAYIDAVWDRLRSLARDALPRRRIAAVQRRAPELRAQASTSRNALLRFGNESDQGFTALARGLSQLNDHFTTLRAKAEQLDLVLQDRDEDRAISAASLLYKNAVDLVHSSVSIATAEQQQMDGIRRALTESCKAREVFNRNHLMLRILSMNMRMEAVRLEPEFQTIFVNISASIAEIDDKIVTSTGTAFDQIEAVIDEAVASQDRSKSLEQDLQQCANASVSHIERELETLKAALAPCADQSRRIASLITETGPATLQVIGSLQHQDIVRQQLEHVSSGFDDLCAHLQPSATTLSADSGYIHQAARIQQAHIRGSRTEIEKASAEVEEGLHALLGTSTSLLTHFTELEQTAAGALQNCHVADTFAEGIRKLVEVAHQSEEANNHSSGLVSRIENVVQVFSCEIASHELDVKIVALNAQIASTHIASADSLSRIAEEVSIIADQNGGITRDLTRNFRTSLDNVHEIKKEASLFLAVASREKRELEQSAATVAAKLKRLCDRVREYSAEALQGFQSAHDENQALLQRLNFASLIDECYAPAEQLCQLLLEATRESAGENDLSETATRHLEKHRSRYTMHKENAAHAAALGTAALAPAPATPEPELFMDDSALSASSIGASMPPATDTPFEPVTNNPSSPATVGAAARPAQSGRGPGFGECIELF